MGWGDLSPRRDEFQKICRTACARKSARPTGSAPRIIRKSARDLTIAFGFCLGSDPHRPVTGFSIGASRAAPSSSSSKCVSRGYVLRPLRYYSSAIGALRRGAPPRSDRPSDAPPRGTRGGGGGRPNPNQSCPGWSHRGREGRARAPTCNARANGGPHVDAFSD